MKYECWHGMNFTRVHTSDCARRSVNSKAEYAMTMIGEFASAQQAYAFAKTRGHRVAICKVCCPDQQDVDQNR